MTAKSILPQIALGEDSTHQFKVDVRNGESLAAEMGAFANSGGGTLYIGVADDGATPGLSYVAKGLLPYHGLGSGIKRALTLWPQIDFTDDREGCLFVATVHRHAPLNAPVNRTASGLQAQLLHLIKSDPHVSYDQLAALTQKDRTTIMRNMAKLKLEGKVQRVGAKKSGHWEVSE